MHSACHSAVLHAQGWCSNSNRPIRLMEHRLQFVLCLLPTRIWSYKVLWCMKRLKKWWMLYTLACIWHPSAQETCSRLCFISSIMGWSTLQPSICSCLLTLFLMLFYFPFILCRALHACMQLLPTIFSGQPSFPSKVLFGLGLTVILLKENNLRLVPIYSISRVLMIVSHDMNWSLQILECFVGCQCIPFHLFLW